MTPDAPLQDRSLSQRLQDLEQWKVTAEARIKSLESLFKIHGDRVAVAPISDPAKLLTVVVSNKRFDPSDSNMEKFEDNVWWDAEYTASGLQKPARSIKGVLCFCDLFGDPQFQVRVTIDDPMKPRGAIRVRGVGIEYNQFLDPHKWLRSTELANMTFRFDVDTVLYEDGTTERFGE